MGLLSVMVALWWGVVLLRSYVNRLKRMIVGGGGGSWEGGEEGQQQGHVLAGKKAKRVAGAKRVGKVQARQSVVSCARARVVGLAAWARWLADWR